MEKISFRDAVIPEAIEKEKQGLITWGEDNLYPQYLNGLKYDNPVHGGIIGQKIKFITAGGVTIDTDELNVLTGNIKLQEIIESLVDDFETVNGYTVLFTKTTKGWQASPIDIELIRVCENMVYFEYSEDWRSNNKTESNWRKIKNITSVTQEDKECLLYHIIRPKQRILEKNKKLSKGYYPIPNYSGAITSINALTEMSFFTFAEVVNGFKGGALVSLNNGIPETDDERRKVVDSIKQDSSDKSKQGGIVVTFADSSENAPTVMQLSGNDLDKRYETTKKQTTQEIMIAHEVISPALFGVMAETMFGSREEMELAYLIFKENYVKFRQRNIVEPLTWAFRRLNGFKGKITFNDYTPEFFKPKQTTTTEQDSFSKQQSTDEVIAMFAKCGRQKSDFKIKHSESCDFSKTSEEYLSLFRSKFAINLTDNDRKILKMINDGESYQAVLRALEISAQKLAVKLKVFEDNGLTDGWKLTESALNEIEEVSDFEVLYSYEEKRNAPSLVAGGTSRPFCLQMLGLDRLYTRQEIDLISSQIGRDVWMYRGGWYHNPVTDRNTPSCRHEWRVNIVNVN